MIDRFERFSSALFSISRSWHQIASSVMEEFGLKGAHAIYLVVLLREPAGLTGAQLAELSAKDKSDVSRAVSLLEKEGILEKETLGAKEHQYRAKLFLTEKGKTVASHVSKKALQAAEIAGQELDDESRAQFYTALEAIAANLKYLSEKGLPQK